MEELINQINNINIRDKNYYLAPFTHYKSLKKAKDEEEVENE